MQQENPISYSRYACFDRAKNLLDKKDDSLLRYVCLELRHCIEAITYDKLKLYEDRLPASLLNNIWQPPQALKALLNIEPEAGGNFKIWISPESEPGVPTGDWEYLGEHKTFEQSWLKKTYQKLGNYQKEGESNRRKDINMPEHYVWDGVCDGWYLLKFPDLR